MKPINEKVTWGNYVSLIAAILFFSGLLTTKTEWWGIFDFMTVKGAFGMVVAKVQNAAGSITTTMSNFQGKGGSGATDGFVFALTLTPVVIFAIAMVSILEHYGALKAARRLLTPILRPLMGLPGVCGLALIASLQSVDSGAAFTKSLYEQGEINDDELNTFAALQVSSGATITNLFGSGAALWALSDGAGGHAIACSIGVTLGVILIFKVIAANIMRLVIKSASKKAGEEKTEPVNLEGQQA